MAQAENNWLCCTLLHEYLEITESEGRGLLCLVLTWLQVGWEHGERRVQGLTAPPAWACQEGLGTGLNGGVSDGWA